MSGGYSRKGTAHNNRVDRSVDDARRAAAEAQRTANRPREQRAAKIAAALANAPAVGASELVVGRLAIDRKMRAGFIDAVTDKTVRLRDSEGIEWRVLLDDIIRIEVPDA